MEISVAPMMDWTDRHCRYFLRLIAPSALLYTEMVTAAAILHGDRKRLLAFAPAEHPIALQLGGSDPRDLAEAARIGASYGYDQINLNCGCPSDRVQSGRFGACLMKEPAHVADCIAAMQDAVDVPVTVKCRIGIDTHDSFEFLDEFVNKIADKGCKTFIIHARKAWLNGLSPKENREKPPLDYARARAIKEKHPHLRIVLNGGITEMGQIHSSLLSPRKRGSSEDAQQDPRFRGESNARFDGLMIGRAAYHNPWFLREIECALFSAENSLAREDVVLRMMDYARIQRETLGTPIKSITRHMMGLYHGQKRGKAWRRMLSTLPYAPGADETVLPDALNMMADQTLAA